VATDAKANPNTAQAQETLRRVMELLALENDLEAAVGPQAQALHAYPQAASAVERFHTMIKEHRDALRSYLDSRGEGAEPTASMVRVFVSDGPHPHVVSDILRNDYTAFTYAAISYAMLFELGLRLFDPDLRALAPKHLYAYTAAAQTINQLIVSTVADELAAAGLECRCVCPMCSMGACGCVSLGTATLSAAWRETAPDGEVPPGFPLQPPRSGSPLALAGVQGGDRLLEVDGERVGSIGEIQAAIRKHPIGDGVHLLLQRDATSPREIQVEHVGDYPQA
jgi:membrane-associated protease RseP (regulator of RpoE activity)